MTIEHPQTTVHVHQPRLTHEVELALFMHEDMQPDSIRRDLYVILFLHPFELVLVDLHEEPSPNSIATSKVHNELIGIALRPLKVVFVLCLHSLILLPLIGSIL
jgi:hypothetical protein